MVKNPPASAGDIRDVGSTPGLGRSPGGGHGSPLQYSCQRIPWTEEPGGVTLMAQSQTQLKLLSAYAETKRKEKKFRFPYLILIL